MFGETVVVKKRLSWIVWALFFALGLSIVILRLHPLYIHRVTAVAAGLEQLVDAFDYRIMLFLNRFAHRSWLFDTFFYLIDSNSLATAPIFVVLWWAWFKESENLPRNREFMLCGVICSFLAVFVARLLALWLPFRERPLRKSAALFSIAVWRTPGALVGLELVSE